MTLMVSSIMYILMACICYNVSLVLNSDLLREKNNNFPFELLNIDTRVKLSLYSFENVIMIGSGVKSTNIYYIIYGRPRNKHNQTYSNCKK